MTTTVTEQAVERAVLRLWPREIWGQPPMLGCNLCDSRPTYFKSEKEYTHTDDCVVPSLVVKYGWYDEIPLWSEVVG